MENQRQFLRLIKNLDYYYICKLYEQTQHFDQSTYLSAVNESLAKILVQCFTTNGPVSCFY